VSKREMLFVITVLTVTVAMVSALAAFSGGFVMHAAATVAVAVAPW
jgi:hypothetical protein